VLVWLLRNRFLYQVHSYVTLLPSVEMSANTTTDSRTRSDISMSDSSTDASSLSTCVFAGGSDVVNLQSLSVSDVDNSAGNSGVSDGRRIHTDTKDHSVSSEFYFSMNVNVTVNMNLWHAAEKINPSIDTIV